MKTNLLAYFGTFTVMFKETKTHSEKKIAVINMILVPYITTQTYSSATGNSPQQINFLLLFWLTFAETFTAEL